MTEQRKRAGQAGHSTRLPTKIPGTPVGKAKISLRIPWFQYGNEARRDELLAWMKRYPGTIDEVAMFAGLGMFPPDLRVVEHQVADLEKAMPMFRALGLTVGIDQHTTIGCHYERAGQTLNQPWQKMVGPNGATGQCYCASDSRMQEYIRRLYVMLAGAGPEFIWMDDDIGLTSVNGCFCNLCLDRFAQETGRRWSRAGLRAAFNRGSGEERLAVRKAWLAHNRRYLGELYALIRGAVDQADPALPLGCMNGERPYEGFGYEEIAAALAGPQQQPVKWRPGGGFYTDMLPSHVLVKGHMMGRIAGALPQFVTDIQSENESFPSQSRQKSAAMLGLEIGVDLAAGCTGSALNFLPNTRDPLEEHRHKFAIVHAQRPFYDRLAATFGRSACEGIWAARTRDHFATQALVSEDWPNVNPLSDAQIVHELSENGLPIAYGRPGAAVTILQGDTGLEFSRAELLKMLSGGVCLDGPALARLNRMGFAEHTGFTVQRTFSGRECEPFQEGFTADPLNGEFAGWQRDLWGPRDVHLLAPAVAHSRVLAEIAHADPKGHLHPAAKTLGASSGVFENRLGGRVAVLGCRPWSDPSLLFNMSLNLARSSQLKTLMRWLSRDTLPAYVGSFSGKIGLWARRDSRGRPALFVVNVSLDPAEEIHILIREAPRALKLFRANASAAEQLAPGKSDGAYGRFVIDRLAPWEMAMLANDEEPV